MLANADRPDTLDAERSGGGGGDDDVTARVGDGDEPEERDGEQIEWTG